jgi:hypothetical protein
MPNRLWLEIEVAFRQKDFVLLNLSTYLGILSPHQNSILKLFSLATFNIFFLIGQPSFPGMVRPIV